MKINSIEQGLKLIDLAAAECLSQTGEVPYAVIARLGLSTEIIPGNAWLGVPPQTIAKLGDRTVAVSEAPRKTC